METSAVAILLAPMLLELTTQVGVHPIHFGIITVVNLVIGMVTPPLGICLFAGSAISGVRFEDIVRQI